MFVYVLLVTNTAMERLKSPLKRGKPITAPCERAHTETIHETGNQEI